MSAINRNGQVVGVGDYVTIIAQVVSYTGSGSLASVTVQAPLDPGTFVVQANDCEAVEHSNDSTHTCVSVNGKAYGVAGDLCTPRGQVTVVSGSGINAILTVKLSTSQTSINTAAGNCASASETGGLA
jgi:hypothetical protein